MTRTLQIDPRQALPIWKQIEENVAALVAAGSLAPGAAVPSVRELAVDLKVNPATVAKAYQRLVDRGVLEVRRGEGTFVALRPAVAGRGERGRKLRDAAHRYAVQAIGQGASEQNAIHELSRAWARLVTSPEGEKP